MTENKMPDVAYLYVTSNRVRMWSLSRRTHHHATISYEKNKYLRSKPVEALLKQARDVVAIYNDEYKGYGDLIASIDKFLVEDK